MPLKLHVINGQAVSIGRLEARKGLQTTYGEITRFTEKTVWTRGKSGVEMMHRAYDGRLPSILLHRLSKADKIAAGVIAAQATA